MKQNKGKKQDSETIEKIKSVTEERKLLSESCKALSDELEGKTLIVNIDLPNRASINRLLIDISEHLGAIAGFCDRNSRKKISKVTKLISVSMLESMNLYVLKLLLPEIAGIQVDFNKRPFRLVNIRLGNFANIEFRK